MVSGANPAYELNPPTFLVHHTWKAGIPARFLEVLLAWQMRPGRDAGLFAWACGVVGLGFGTAQRLEAYVIMSGKL